MPNPAKRFTANPARPVGRYRPGKVIAEHESSDEDESEEEPQEKQAPQRRPPPSKSQPTRRQVQRQEESEEDDEDGFVTDEEGATDTVTHQVAVTSAKSVVTAKDHNFRSGPADVSPPQSEEEDEETEESEESEEEEESAEEEAPKRKFQRPTFIKKSDRSQPLTVLEPSSEVTRNTVNAPDPEMETQARRLAQAELLIKDKLERDALARSQGKKAWDDDDQILPESMVDDTDGLDPEAEHAAWKLRELKRLKRDREALIAREKEIEEIERRRNLTAEEREREDKAYLEKQTTDREENRQEASYLARYHHKGAFFQGDEAAEILKQRDVMGARFEDQVSDKSVLPEYMRIRDMTKLGKKGRTRYTDMKTEDTGRFGDDVKRWRGSGGGPNGSGRGDFDIKGVDERFLPDDQRGGGTTGPTGANASAVAPRRERGRDEDRERRKRSYSRSRSRTRSPQRRKRDHSYDRDSRDRHTHRQREGART